MPSHSAKRDSVWLATIGLTATYIFIFTISLRLMLSKAQAKQIRALHRKKNRQDEGLFLVEGEKIVVELLRSDWRIHSLFATPTFLEEYKALVHDRGVDAFECDAEALTKTGTLRSNNAAVAGVHMAPEGSSAPTGWTPALEDITIGTASGRE